MAESYSTLKKMSDKDLITKHDCVAGGTVPGLNLYRDELAHRDAIRVQEQMASLARQMRNLTIVIGFLTLVNVCVAIMGLVIE